MRTMFVAIVLLAGPALASEPAVKSGLAVGERPGPYAFVMATGPERGQSYCYICATADKPAAIIFARTLTEPLGQLAAKLDRAAADGAIPELKTWMTVLDDGKQPDLERRLVAWGRQHALRVMPLGIFEDETGPPTYRLHREADATVMVFVNQKVVANFAIRSGDLSETKIAQVVKALDQLNKKPAEK